MKRSMSAVFLASAISLSAFDNLDFEQIPPPPDPWSVEVPSWQHIGANGGGGGYWNVNGANLSGWAEASVVYFADPPLQGTIWFPPPPPIDGLLSMALSGSWPAGTTTADYFGPEYTNYGFTGSEDIGRAWIGQTGTIEPDAPWLTLTTDYAGRNETISPRPPEVPVFGYLTISFDGAPVAFTLEDAGTGSVGQPLRQLRADLSPFAGQTGELRIGIEGPHTFVIDNIQLVPEPSPLALLVACLGAVCLRGMLRSHAKKGTPL